MQRLRLLFFGLVLTFAAAACGSGPSSESVIPTQIQAASTPTDRPPVVSHIPPVSLPQICNCTLRFDHINIEQGLSQSSVQIILQDRRGFLWFGTQDGLNRYDGYEFKVYKPDPDDANSLSDRWITSIVEDKHGYLWIATRFGGVNRYDPRTE